MLPADRRDSLPVTSIRSWRGEVGMTITKEAVTACWHPNDVRAVNHQPKYPIERGEPQDILRRLVSVANDNGLAWPLIPFPED